LCRVGRSSVLRVSAGNGKWQTVPAADVKALINDKGYTILDIRSPTEVSEVGYKFTWQTIPLAALTDEGPVRNPYFLATVKEAFPNTMSRMLVVRPCALPPARRSRAGHPSIAICTRVAPIQMALV